MAAIEKSRKLDNVCYDIRGPVMEESIRMEEEGISLIKLNIGNLAPFGFKAPDEIVRDMIRNLSEAEGYSASKGLFAARKAIMHECQRIGIPGVELDDIYTGNGVSELIQLTTQALLNRGDEMLVPAPDYPLWTASVNLAGGRAVHYLCDEGSGWIPDLADMESKINENTRAIVVINPNNPTGGVYPKEVLLGIVELARRHNLIIFADEIYDKILYDDAVHIPLASLGEDIFVITFNGLSKAYRSCGFRAGWMVLSGDKKRAAGYIEGLNMLSNMRLCSNVPGQFAIQTALGGYQSIGELINPEGRLYKQRDYLYERLTTIPGISCQKPKGALYLFPKVDRKRFNINDDMQFVLDLLRETHILTVQGTGFNWPEPDHFRIVFLPNRENLALAADRMEKFFETYRQA
ncbi:MAG: pyridoxal phosphate-dependent aminotransferase [Spirochaetales bacterium]|nr:pyridoxal phosphate-dependent aminotransferase [Spirochaetales bacterium]